MIKIMHMEKVECHSIDASVELMVKIAMHIVDMLHAHRMV
jgi:hypothetical protein